MRKFVCSILIAAGLLAARTAVAEPLSPTPQSLSAISGSEVLYASDYVGKTFKVKGGAGIVQFVKAIGLLDDEHSDEEPKPTIDKANGFYDYFQEGSGSIHYTAAYWNRKDGKKLLIMSYCESDFVYSDDRMRQAVATPRSSAWHRFDFLTWDSEGEMHLLEGDPSEYDRERLSTQETGYAAWIYNTAKQQLEPVKSVTEIFHGLPQGKAPGFLLLPQKGKDIVVQEGHGRDMKETLLKWNGMSFDYKR